MGSTCAASRAGTRHAINAIAASKTVEPASSAGLCAETSYKLRCQSRRPSANADAIPIASPMINTGSIPWLRIESQVRCGSLARRAPSARRSRLCVALPCMRLRRKSRLLASKQSDARKNSEEPHHQPRLAECLCHDCRPSICGIAIARPGINLRSAPIWTDFVTASGRATCCALRC